MTELAAFVLRYPGHFWYYCVPAAVALLAYGVVWWRRRAPLLRRRRWICSDCLGDTISNPRPIWLTQLWCWVRFHDRSFPRA